jgi:hypothetical protein
MRFDEFMKSIARQGGSKIALRIGQDRIRRWNSSNKSQYRRKITKKCLLWKREQTKLIEREICVIP